jgi:Glyoxalase-like domain
MAVELDHILVCTSPGAPEGDDLVRFGLTEGPRNQHPGQGTANQRFAFRNAMLELFWVCEEKEARSEQTRRTQLWERWVGRDGGACPFGICLRPGVGENRETPFQGWEYHPAYLPDPLAMQIGEAGLEEPMWVYLGFLTREQRERHFVAHAVGIREITKLILTSAAPPRSAVSKIVTDADVLSVRRGPKPLLEIEFDHGQRQKVQDFRPHLPLLFRF